MIAVQYVLLLGGREGVVTGAKDLIMTLSMLDHDDWTKI